MKIGILTFHNAYNFGAVLQAYALQTFLEEKGHQVEIVDYRNDEVELSYKLFRFKAMPKYNPFRFAAYWITQLFRQKKYNKFKKEVHHLLNESSQVKNINDPILAEKDIIVVGSDQLWNRKITGIYDPMYWGYFSKKIKGKVITYAVCMNTDSLTSDDLQFIKNNLDNFSSLSVREDDLADILRPLTSKKIAISLDPTMMVESGIWHKLIKNTPPPFKEPYVLVYAILERKKVIENASNFATLHRMRLVIMSPIADVSPFKEYYIPTSPIDFIAAIANAEYVITSSFHGLAFSTIFHREVYVMGDNGKNVRMKSLLRNIGLEDRFVINVNREYNKIDYITVDEKLDKLRSGSQQYLLNAIK